MRTIALCSLILAVVVLGIDARTGAQAAWCAQYFNGGTNCGFSSLQQCLETVRGIGGQCGPDGSGSSVERSRPPSERREARPPREPKQKPVATAPRPRPAIEREATEPPRPVAVEPPRPATPPPVAEPAPAAQPTNSFAAGRALILSGKYEAAITALRALGYDDHPDIAASIGFANAKLGRLDEARLWYEKALAADPNHISALAYYGVLRAQQGDVTTARANLEKVRALCGGAQCLEYQDLAGALAARPR